MSNPKISIIVPIYNTESTLLRCLDSLKAQTLTDFEVLMVDDGSPDRCGEMIDEYAAKDSRFKAFHKPNGGVSSSRQFGIDHAIGEYTIHADPDDWVEPTMLEELYRKAKDDNAEMVICDYYEDSYSDSKYINQKPTSSDPSSVLRDLFHFIHGCCWNKLIKRKCLLDYGIHFPAGVSYCEDQYFIASLLKHSIRISYLHNAFYHYINTVNQDSLSRMYTKNTYLDDKRIIDLFSELLHNTDVHREAYNSKVSSMVSRAFYFGYQYYSSKDFKHMFYHYNSLFLKEKVGRSYERPILFFSCIGFYHLMFRLYRALFYIKSSFH